MTDSRLTFGQMLVLGELAQGVHPADDLGLQMAMALGQPDDPAPAFAVVPVLLDGQQIGTLSKIRYTWGAELYQFTSWTGNTKFCCSCVQAALLTLHDKLGLAS
jgi:hypothetical protein